MTPLDELERGVLQDARAYLEPSPTDETRLYSRLSVHLGLPGAVTSPHVATVTPSNRPLSSRLTQALTSKRVIAITFAAIGTLAGTLGGYHAGVVAGQSAQSVKTAERTGDAVKDVARDHSIPVVHELSTAPEVAAAVAEVPRAIERTKPSLSHSTETAPTIDLLGEEVALLKRAERAIRSSNALLALGLVRELDQRFPKGKLLAERNAARVMANCLQLEPTLARKAGEAYLRNATNSVYHERVRQLCGIAPATSFKNSNVTEKGSVSSGD